MRIDVDNLTQAAVARCFGVSARTVRQWTAELGAPRNADGTYSLPRLIRWRLDIEAARADEADTGDESGEALARFRLARAKITELDLAERRCELVRADVVRAGAARAGVVFAAALRALGPRLAVRLAGMDDPNDVDQELADEAERVIGDLNANMGAIVREGVTP